jgi:hypothetical protein
VALAFTNSRRPPGKNSFNHGLKVLSTLSLRDRIEKQILTDEPQDPKFLNFAVENISELFGYLATGRVNIRIHRDIEGKMWFGVGEKI